MDILKGFVAKLGDGDLTSWAMVGGVVAVGALLKKKANAAAEDQRPAGKHIAKVSGAVAQRIYSHTFFLLLFLERRAKSTRMVVVRGAQQARAQGLHALCRPWQRAALLRFVARRVKRCVDRLEL